MNLGEYLPANNLLILGAGLLIAVVAFLWFMRKPRNRHPLDNPHGRELDEERARHNAQGTTEAPPTRRP